MRAGSARPDNWENTDLKLCWTKSYLKIVTVATDSEIISNQPNCGDSTWNGDSIETFIAPGEADATAWMEMDVSAAGGMYFAAIHGDCTNNPLYTPLNQVLSYRNSCPVKKSLALVALA